MIPLCSLPLLGQQAATPKALALQNPGFEDKFAGWIVDPSDGGKSTISDAVAHTGKLCLKVIDEDKQSGSSLRSASMPAEANKQYKLKFWAKNQSGSGMNVYLVFTAANGEILNTQKRGNECVVTLPPEPTEDWKPMTLIATAPPEATAVYVFLHSGNGATVTAYLDDFSLAQDSSGPDAEPAVIIPKQVDPQIKAGFQPVDSPVIAQKLDIANVWSGHSVGFYLLTHEKTQFVAFYDANRQMTLGQRDIDSAQWTFKKLDSYVGWDSHNYVTMALDSDNCLHVSGNMHVNPLVYFRGTKPLDIQSVERVKSMVGDREERTTYPVFMKGPNDKLVFIYRDGQSGNGDNLYNIYDAEKKTWTRLLPTALLEGKGKMNAYASVPAKGPDDYYHMAWVWRTNPGAEFCEMLSYAKSKDLTHWETVAGKPVALPASIETPGLIVDPIPLKGGIINGSGRIGFDKNGALVIAYHKYDKRGNTQMYFARFEHDAWKIYEATNWDYRWDFGGGGSLGFGISHGGVEVVDGKLAIRIRHKKYGSGLYEIDPVTMKLGEKIPEHVVVLPNSLTTLESNFPGVNVMWANGSGQAADGRQFRLRWETLPANRDQPREKPWPAASILRVIEVKPPQ